MKARGNFVLFFLIILFSLYIDSLAQQASAELISSSLPAKLKSGEQVKDGIQNVFLKDNRLYIANIWAGLQILDVTDPVRPKELASFNTENRAHNVFVQDKYAYVSNELSGVLVFDISQLPAIKQVARIRTQGEAYWVIANYPYVYVAEETKGVNIYDLSDLANVRMIGSYDTQGWAWCLSLENSDLFVAEKNGGIIVLDVSFPGNPTKVGQFPGARNVKALQVENGVAYLANGPDGLWLLDVTNPSFPHLLSKLDFEGYIYDVNKSGNTVFLANELRHRVEIVDVTNIMQPVKEGEFTASGNVYGVFKKDIYVYVAADIHSLILRYNRPPRITPVASQTVDENKLMQILAFAEEPDGDAIYFSADNLPAGAKFDSLKGELNWTPDYEQSGLYQKIRITVNERTASALSASTTFDIAVAHVNRSPAIADVGDQTIDENSALTFTIPQGSDPDKEDKGKLFYTADNIPEGASFDAAARVFSWTPDFEQSGVYTVDFAVNDGAGGVARDACVITVNHVDRKPLLVQPEIQVINENQPLTLILNGSDPDKEDQASVKYKADNLPEGARFNEQTATLTWTPTYDQSGDYKKLKFVFTAGKLSDTVFVDAQVKHVNRAPVMVAITDKSVDENKPLGYKLVCSDPDREDTGKLLVKADNLPQGARFNADSLTFYWLPGFEQSGLYETVSFTVNDPDGLTDTKSLNIKVNHINRSPALAVIEPQTVNENALLSFTLTGTDPDREDDGKLIYKALELPAGATLQGAVFNWTPTFDQSGNYNITFQVTDPAGLSVQQKTTVTVIHVNRPPALAQVAPQNVDENKLLAFSATVSDPDIEDKGKLAITAAALPEGSTFDVVTGKFTWTPGFEQSGTVKVNFTVTDPAGLKDEKTVDISVAHVNRTPVFAPLPAQTLQENTAWTYPVVAAQDPDKEDLGKLNYSVTGLPAGAVFDDQTLSLSWTPGYDQSGDYTTTITVTDEALAVPQPLKIQVQHVNRPPQITPPSDATLTENTAWTYKVDYHDPDKEDAGKLTIEAVNLPSGATFNAAAAQLSWKPDYDQAGVFSGIKIITRDPAGLSDEKSFTLNVTNVNRPPTLNALLPTAGVENTPVSAQLNASDPDKEDAGKLTFSSANLPQDATLDAASGAFNWQPGFLQAGVYQITFRVSDTGGLSSEQTMSVTIADLNRAPLLADVPLQTVKENTPLTFSLSAKDEDTDNTLTYSMKNAPQGAELDAATGAFKWTPSFEQAGVQRIIFAVTDGKAVASVTAEITVENVNRPPQFDGLRDATVDENSPLSFTVKANDPDAGSQLSYSAESVPQGVVFDAGTFSWKPTFEQAGEFQVTFIVTDGETPVSKAIKITVKNVNRKPEINGPSGSGVEAGSALNLEYTASDPDGETITFSASGLPSGAQLESRSGKFSWTPSDDQVGPHSFEVSASDGSEAVTIKTTIQVSPKPQTAPPDTTGN